MKLNKKQIAILKKSELHLKTAGETNYITGMYSSEVINLFDLYRELFNESPGSVSCSHCRLRVCKRLWNVYKNNTEQDER